MKGILLTPFQDCADCLRCMFQAEQRIAQLQQKLKDQQREIEASNAKLLSMQEESQETIKKLETEVHATKKVKAL